VAKINIRFSFLILNIDLGHYPIAKEENIQSLNLSYWDQPELALGMVIETMKEELMNSPSSTALAAAAIKSLATKS